MGGHSPRGLKVDPTPPLKNQTPERVWIFGFTSREQNRLQVISVSGSTTDSKSVSRRSNRLWPAIYLTNSLFVV